MAEFCNVSGAHNAVVANPIFRNPYYYRGTPFVTQGKDLFRVAVEQPSGKPELAVWIGGLVVREWCPIHPNETGLQIPSTNPNHKARLISSGFPFTQTTK